MLRFATRIGLIILFGLAQFTGATTLAQDGLSPRLHIGVNLLPAIIAANKSLATTDPDQNLPIYLVYREDPNQAEYLEQHSNLIGEIRNRSLDVITITLDELLASEPPPLAVVFITEPLDQRLPDLLQFARHQRALLFSPFDGDVEHGVATGFQVTDKVLPLVNMTALKQTKIQLKAFFLRIAVKHE